MFAFAAQRSDYVTEAGERSVDLFCLFETLKLGFETTIKLRKHE